MDASIICFGAAHLDLKASAKTAITWGEKVPVSTSMSFGGVARNVAENLCRLGKNVALISRLGRDQAGELVRANLDQLGIDGHMISTSTVKQTASFTALIAQNGDMAIALSDMEIYDEMHILDEELRQLEHARIWLVDANLPEAMLCRIAGSCPPWISLWAAGTSVAKNPRFLTIVNDVDVLVVNHQEAAIFSHAPPRTMVVTKGCRGAELVEQGVALVFPCTNEDVIDATGAGDAFIAGLAYGFLKEGSLSNAMPYGHACARLTLKTFCTVNRELTEALLLENMHN